MLVFSATPVCSLLGSLLGSPSPGDQPISHHPTGGMGAPLFLPHTKHFPSSIDCFLFMFNPLMLSQWVFLWHYAVALVTLKPDWVIPDSSLYSPHLTVFPSGGCFVRLAVRRAAALFEFLPCLWPPSLILGGWASGGWGNTDSQYATASTPARL